jgi:hypothetical protein
MQAFYAARPDLSVAPNHEVRAKLMARQARANFWIRHFFILSSSAPRF